MDHSINLYDRVGISDVVRVETEVDASIYRLEFERHRMGYLATKVEIELIFAFVFLQIYVECFLHQNMRRIVEFEFKPPRDGIREEWLREERRHVSDKIEAFATLFFTSDSIRIHQLVGAIKEEFGQISCIRNLFVHGHKVATWSDSSSGSGLTPARKLLTEERLVQVTAGINELGSAWNELLDNIQLQCKALQKIDDFKFSNM